MNTVTPTPTPASRRTLSFQRVWVLTRKEFLEFRRDLTNFIPILLLPVVFGIIFPALAIFAVSKPEFSHKLDELFALIKNLTTALNIAGGDTRAAALGTLFDVMVQPLFLLIPLLVSVVAAAMSFAGEKENKTLEGLLYTPLTNIELLLGKLLAAFLPAVAVGWLSVALFVGVTQTLSQLLLGVTILSLGRWILLALLLLPLVVMLAMIAVVFISQRAETIKSASSMSSILVFPLIALVVSQITGVFVFGYTAMWIVAGVLAVVDLVGFFVLSRAGREAIFHGKTAHKNR